MIGEQPIEKGDEPVRTEALPRAASAIPNAMPDPVADIPPGAGAALPGAAPRALGGRRISFAAWGLAGIAGVALWVALFKFA